MNSKKSNRSGFFDWFAGGPKAQRHYRPTLNEYIGKLATQFEKNGRTKSDTMTEAETELDAALNLLAYVDPDTGARSLKVDGKSVPLPMAFDRFGDKPAESDIPSLKGIDWSKSTVAIPKFEETFGPPDTAEQNQKLFAMQKANAAELIGQNPQDQKQFWGQIKQYWDNRAALYRAKYERAPPNGMFPTVPTYMSPEEVKAAADRAATEQRIAEQDARIKRLEELLLQQNQKR